MVSADGVATDAEKIKVVEEWQTPHNLRDLRSFLGLCSYYRRFIQGFSTLAKPLTKLTEKNQDFIWGPDQEAAWQGLKGKLISAPVLAYPDPKKPYILDTDASGVGIGAVLSQEQDGKERVIAYGSRTLTKEERRYCVTRRELLAIVHFVKQYRHYLYGRRFLIRTDHGALKWLTSFKDLQGQVARWLEVLGTYDFEIQHRPGLKHGNADSLSRRPCKQCGWEEDGSSKHRSETEVERTRRVTTRTQSRKALEGEKPSNWLDDGPLSRQNLVKEQTSNPEVSWMVERKRTGSKPTWKEVAPRGAECKALWGQWESLQLHHRLLCREKRRDGERRTEADQKDAHGRRVWVQVVVPQTLREDVLRAMHDAVTAGHLGTRKTLTVMQRRFYWPQMKKYVREWCKKCTRCAARKSPQRRAKAAMQRYQVGEPMERVAIEVMGPFPTSRKGNRYVIVMADYFTKWVEAVATPDQEAKTVAEVFVQQFLAKFGAPRVIHTDQGRNFESRLFTEMCKLLGIKKTHTTVYHPQSDGMVERFNRTIGTMIVAYAAGHPTWDEQLPLLTMAYRATPHASTGYSPNRVMLGREVALPVDIMMGVPLEEDRGQEPEYVAALRDRLQSAYNHVQENLQTAARRQKNYYDQGVTGTPYEVGDLVWRMNKTRRKGISPKLQSRWLGPCVIREKINDVTYKIQVMSHRFCILIC